MNNEIETINYRGHEIKTYYDEDAQSPNEWGDDDAFLVYDHRDFYVKRDGFDPDDIWEALQDKHKQTKTYDGHYVFPVYAYIHSGVSLSLGRLSYPFTCPWDTSMKGFALVRRDKGTWSIKQAERVAKSIISEWNEYLSGDIYGYDSEHGGSWGFHGQEGYKEMIEEAKSEIDDAINKKIHEHFNRLKTYIRNRVPFQYRVVNEFSATTT